MKSKTIKQSLHTACNNPCCQGRQQLIRQRQGKTSSIYAPWRSVGAFCRLATYRLTQALDLTCMLQRLRPLEMRTPHDSIVESGWGPIATAVKVVLGHPPIRHQPSAKSSNTSTPGVTPSPIAIYLLARECQPTSAFSPVNAILSLKARPMQRVGCMSHRYPGRQSHPSILPPPRSYLHDLLVCTSKDCSLESS